MTVEYLRIGIGAISVKIYKNPFVSYDSYFVKTGKASTRKMEASASKGYEIHNMKGQWEIHEVEYYDYHVKTGHPLIAENHVAVKTIIEEAVLNAVLRLVGER
jgi:hypothetical protein